MITSYPPSFHQHNIGILPKVMSLQGTVLCSWFSRVSKDRTPQLSYQSQKWMPKWWTYACCSSESRQMAMCKNRFYKNIICATKYPESHTLEQNCSSYQVWISVQPAMYSTVFSLTLFLKISNYVRTQNFIRAEQLLMIAERNSEVCTLLVQQRNSHLKELWFVVFSFFLSFFFFFLILLFESEFCD